MVEIKKMLSKTMQIWKDYLKKTNDLTSINVKTTALQG